MTHFSSLLIALSHWSNTTFTHWKKVGRKFGKGERFRWITESFYVLEPAFVYGSKYSQPLTTPRILITRKKMSKINRKKLSKINRKKWWVKSTEKNNKNNQQKLKIMLCRINRNIKKRKCKQIITILCYACLDNRFKLISIKVVDFIFYILLNIWQDRIRIKLTKCLPNSKNFFHSFRFSFCKSLFTLQWLKMF